MTCHRELRNSPADDSLPVAAPDAVPARSSRGRTYTVATQRCRR